MIAAAILALTLTAASAAPTLSAFAGIAPRAAADAAVAASPDVAAARAHVAEMQALVDAAQRSGGPSLTASQTNAPQGGPGGATVEQSLTTLGGAYTFTDAYQHGPAVAQARAALRVAESDVADAQRKERVRTIDLYYDALRALADVQAQRLFVAGARRDEAAARIRFRAGDAPRLDVVPRAGRSKPGRRSPRRGRDRRRQRARRAQQRDGHRADALRNGRARRARAVAERRRRYARADRARAPDRRSLRARRGRRRAVGRDGRRSGSRRGPP